MAGRASVNAINTSEKQTFPRILLGANRFVSLVFFWATDCGNVVPFRASRTSRVWFSHTNEIWIVWKRT